MDRAFKQFVFETMSLTDVDKKNYVVKSNQNEAIPWDDPYPNIAATLSQEKQIVVKSLNFIDAKKEFDEKKSNINRMSSSQSSRSASKSFKFQDANIANSESPVTATTAESPQPSSILKSRPSTKLSGKFFFLRHKKSNNVA